MFQQQNTERSGFIEKGFVLPHTEHVKEIELQTLALRGRVSYLKKKKTSYFLCGISVLKLGLDDV